MGCILSPLNRDKQGADFDGQLKRYKFPTGISLQGGSSPP